MNEEYFIDGDMLDAFQIQVFLNRLEKQKDIIFSQKIDEVLEKVLNGIPYEVAMYEAAEEIVKKLWEGNDNET